jgi:hypothetical protein
MDQDNALLLAVLKSFNEMNVDEYIKVAFKFLKDNFELNKLLIHSKN